MKGMREKTGERGGRRLGQARVARKPLEGRGAVSNHVRANASLERQADEAADRVVRGEGNVSRILTPANPARYDAPLSNPETLPKPVQTELESAFSADLAEVRVHRDGAAQDAARREQARAFTAGRDIYFGEGQFDPNGSEGKRLLAHEVAHVLQQTGRRTATDMIYATPRAGSADIQLQLATAQRKTKGK